MICQEVFSVSDNMKLLVLNQEGVGCVLAGVITYLEDGAYNNVIKH